MPKTLNIKNQHTKDSRINNQAEAINNLNIQNEDKFAPIKSNFSGNVLSFNSVMSKEYFALLSEYFKDKIDSLDKQDYKKYCESSYVQHCFFKKTFRQFLYSINYLSYIDYISNTSDICVVYGEVDKIASCRDGFIFTKSIYCKKSKKSKKIHVLAKDRDILVDSFIFAFGRATIGKFGDIYFNVHNDYLTSFRGKNKIKVYSADSMSIAKFKFNKFEYKNNKIETTIQDINTNSNYTPRKNISFLKRIFNLIHNILSFRGFKNFQRI